jgi:hypothetical protein
MLRIDKTRKSLIALPRKTMRESGYWERRDIQEMICRAPGAFCEEIGEHIWFVGSEVQPTDFVQDRIDLLGVDADGVGVVVEIKRDSHKLHLLQALSYAGMIAKWEPKRFVDELQKFNKTFQNDQQTTEDVIEELEDELEEGDIEIINRSQRIVLLAEEFDYEVLITAEWLTEGYELDIRCYRLALANSGAEEFLTCTRVYPPPELTDIALRRRKKRETGFAQPAENWDEALQSVTNQAVVDFFRSELAARQSDKSKDWNNPKYKILRYFIGGKRRFGVEARRRHAWVWQSGRFEHDIEFWKSRLGDKSQVVPIHDGRMLRFHLSTPEDFSAFKAAVETDLTNTEFHGEPDNTDQQD